MQNFSFPAGLEVTEKFVVGVVVEHVATMSNVNLRLEVLCIELS